MRTAAINCQAYGLFRALSLSIVASVLSVGALPLASRGAEQPAAHEVFRSTDRGRSWTRADRGLPGNSRINAFGSLGPALFAGTDSGIYISRDEGRIWQACTGVAAASRHVMSIATAGQKVFAGTDRNGVIESSDGGMTWVVNTGFPAKKVRSLVAVEGRIYAGTDSDGVYVTDSGGRTWTHLQQGLPPQAQIFAMAALQGKVFAGLYSKGLYAWSAQEGRWIKAGNVSPLALAAVRDTLVAGHNPGGVFWSSDSGATWTKALGARGDAPGELPANAPVWEMGSGGDLIVAGAAAGIYYSEDRGRTWHRALSGLPADSPGVSFLVMGNTVFAGVVVKDSRGSKRE